MKTKTTKKKVLLKSFSKVQNFGKGIKLILNLSILAILFTFSLQLNAQVAINETNADADAKAALDIVSTTKGVLLPNLSETQRNNITTPTTGLIIFNRTVGYFNYYNGLKWCRLDRTVVLTPAVNPGGAASGVGVGVGIADPDNSAILQVNANNKGVLIPRLAADVAAPPEGLLYYNTVYNNIRWYDGAAWQHIGRTAQVSAGSSVANVAEGVAIGAVTVDATAKLDIVSATLGLLIPRMSTAERDLIPSPAEGLLIFNNTAGQKNLQYFVDNAWYKLNTEDLTYGTVVGNPGQSCLDIYQANSTTVDVNGFYYINPTGSSTFQCYCDMTTASDGGGWTLVVSYNTPTGAAGGAMFRTNSAQRDPSVGNVTTDVTAASAGWWTDLRWGPAFARSATWADVITNGLNAPRCLYNQNNAELINWFNKLGTGVAAYSPATACKCTWAGTYVTPPGYPASDYQDLTFPTNNWNLPRGNGTNATWSGYVPSVNLSGGSVLSRTYTYWGLTDCNSADRRYNIMQAWVR